MTDGELRLVVIVLSIATAAVTAAFIGVVPGII